MFNELKDINKKPLPFEFYTADRLWTDQYIAGRMLGFHLNESVDAASRNMRFIDRSAGWIVKKFNLSGGFSVLDFGCGPGLYTLRFAMSGAEVTGIDFSENSLAYARGKAAEHKLNINYIYGNYLDLEPERKYDLVTMIMCDFTALSPLQRNSLLRKFYSLLKPGGSVLLDVYSLGYFNKREEQAVYEFNQMDRFWSDKDYYCFLNTFRYVEERVVLDKYTVYTGTEKMQIYNWAQCYDKQSLADEFARAGLCIKEFYADVSGKEYDEDADEFAVVAQME